LPVQTFGAPETDIAGLTVKVNVASEPQGLLTLYVIVVVPGLTAVTKPEVELIVATPVALLLHVPPLAPVGFESVVDPPKQTELLPVIVPGALQRTVIAI
jgi:hypothetical protein